MLIHKEKQSMIFQLQLLDQDLGIKVVLVLVVILTAKKEAVQPNAEDKSHPLEDLKKR